jgi:predicted amidophosphoribosyltransferase
MTTNQRGAGDGWCGVGDGWCGAGDDWCGAGDGWCGVCDGRTAGGGCPNYWCHRSDRGFETVWAVGEHRGALRRAIAALKYRQERRWAAPLGRLLAQFLVDHAPWFDDIDLIVAVPGNVGAARPFDHVRAILAAAPAIADLWEVDLDGSAIAKMAETQPMAGAGSALARRLWAAGELRAVLVVPEPERVRGRSVLAVDDVFTDGSTLREVAIALRRRGAVSVSGLVLARQPRHPPGRSACKDRGML